MNRQVGQDQPSEAVSPRQDQRMKPVYSWRITMTLKSNIYDVLKYVALIGFPAISTLIGTIGEALNWQHTSVTVIIINAVAVCLGSLLQVSSSNYKKNSDGQ